MFESLLSAWRYGPLFLPKNGVIDNIQIVRHANEKNKFVAYAELSTAIGIEFSKRNVIYGNAHGAGTSNSKFVAICKAMSECIERWAFYHLMKESPRAQHLLLNPSSDGFAAHSNFDGIDARRNAYSEAVERLSLNLLNHRALLLTQKIVRGDVDVYVFDLKENLTAPPGFPELPYFTIVHSFCPALKFHYYGFSGDMDIEKSIDHSVNESARNYRAIKRWLELKSSEMPNSSANEILRTNIEDSNNEFPIYERRLLYFASDAGWQRFQDLLNIEQSAKTSNRTELACDFDSEIQGPWAKYAKVWRVLLSHPDYDYFPDSTSKDVFFF
jgi:hypothetical protein